MRRLCFVLAIAVAVLAGVSLGQLAPTAGPYKAAKTKVGGEGGTDYIYADADARRLYIARTGRDNARVTVFDLDTLAPQPDIPSANAHGVVVSTKSGHGFVSSKPIQMFDSKSLMPLKTIEVMGNPDGMLYDAFNDHVYILSHQAPHVTVINASDGAVLGTMDLGGMPEQAATDGRGHIYIDVEDKANIAVVDAKTMMVTGHYDLTGSGGTCAGLAIDAKNNILFAACRMPANMVILSATDGKIITTIPINGGTDGALFNPNTMEAFSSHGDGTLVVIKESSPTSFAVEQVVETMRGARTSTLDPKTNRVITMASETMPAPTPAPGAAPGGRGGGRGQAVPGSFSIIVVGR
ncbi:MAG TPA: hypothetical protein VH639_24560 [Bryobacteraceae bacterium]|jgi:DNA-binding beta-propeller fold protein YncE